MTLGSYGDVSFSVSATAVETFRNMKMTEGASYGQHKVHGRDTVMEFTGYSAPQVSFEMTLSAFLGVDPRAEYDKLREMLRSGKGYALSLGSDLYGGLWLLTGLTRSFDYLYKDGTPISCKVGVTLTGMEE